MRQKIQKNLFARGPKNLLIIVALFVISLGFLTKLTDSARQVRQMRYSEFQRAVDQDHVRQVYVSGQDVRGILKDGGHFEVTIPENADIWNVLKEHNVEYSVGSNAGAFSNWQLMFLLLLLLLPFAIWYFMRQNKSSGGGNSIFTMGKSKARLIMPSMISETFDSVAGAENAKDALKDIVDYLKNPEKYRKIGAKVPRGVLLVGEPGNGKTLLAKAVAGEANCPFFSITGSDFIEVFVGVGAARVRDMFAQARRHAPSIIFIDEIDAIGRSRGSGFGGGHDEREQTLNQLLTEMDGFETSGAPVIIVAATNMPDVLDKALLRPGRFDRWVNVEYPNEAAREEILHIHARNIKVDADVDFKKIAKETAGFSGADLGNLMNEAAINASKKGQEVVTMDDMNNAHKHILAARSGSSSSSSSAVPRGSSKPAMFVPSQVKTKFSDIAGIPEAKEDLQDVVKFLKDPEKFRRLGAQLPTGVLLVGEPGNGKTLLAKAVAGEANCPFFSVNASDFVEMYVGVGASRVRDLFAQARRHMPSIVFIDEIDAVGGKRVAGSDGGNDERAQTLNQLLTEMDGFNSMDSTVIVMAATNRPDMLDSALVRPGRLGRRVDVPYPDMNSRKQILAVHAKSIKMDDSVDLERLAKGTPGFSGAGLAGIVNEAALIAAKDDSREHVKMEDFEEARDRALIGQPSRSKMVSDWEKKVTAYHEAGHALIRVLCDEHAQPLHKLTILPRGQALGITFALAENKYTQSREELFAELMTALGGRSAELLKFNKMCSGASSDFEKATQIARAMVCKLGMDDEIGPVVYGQGYGEFEYSEKMAEKIDERVHKILIDSQKRVDQMLSENMSDLEKLAEAVYEQETMYADDVYELLGKTPRVSYRLVDEKQTKKEEEVNEDA